MARAGPTPAAKPLQGAPRPARAKSSSSPSPTSQRRHHTYLQTAPSPAAPRSGRAPPAKAWSKPGQPELAPHLAHPLQHLCDTGVHALEPAEVKLRGAVTHRRQEGLRVLLQLVLGGVGGFGWVGGEGWAVLGGVFGVWGFGGFGGLGVTKGHTRREHSPLCCSHKTSTRQHPPSTPRRACTYSRPPFWFFPSRLSAIARWKLFG